MNKLTYQTGYDRTTRVARSTSTLSSDSHSAIKTNHKRHHTMYRICTHPSGAEETIRKGVEQNLHPL